MIRPSILTSSTFLLALSLFGLYGALREFSFHVRVESARSESERKQTGPNFGEKELANWSSIRNLTGIPSSVSFATSQVALREALRAARAEDVTRQRELLCRSFDSLVSASVEQPSAAKMQIALADLQVLIPEPLQYCRDRLSSLALAVTAASAHSTDERLKRAAAIAPWSANELYFSALVRLRVGDRDEAFRLFRRDEEHNPLFSDAERQYVASIVRSPSELELAAPRRYPEIVRWLQIFSQSRPKETLKWSSVFRVALRDAVDELESRFSNGQITSTNLPEYLNHINSQTLSHLDDGVRQRIDRLRAKLAGARNEIELSSFYEARSKLARIPVAKSHDPDDRIPTKYSLPEWSTEQSQVRGWLNGAGTSVGAFFPPRFSPRLLVISSEPESFQLRGDEVELFGSDDNIVFQKVAFETPQVLRTDQSSLLTIPLKGFPFRILKLRTHTGASTLLAAAPMRDLLQIYGEETR